MVVAAGLLTILWSQLAEGRGRAARMLLGARARVLAKGALAHGLHKVEKTVVYFDDALARRPDPRMDVGGEDPAYLADLHGEVDYADGRGSYRVVAMEVSRQESTRGDGVLKVALVAETSVERAGQVRRERLKGEFRLFSGVGGGGRSP